MSEFTYMVKVSTERESGLIVSRDEQSEKILDAFEDVHSSDLSGLGARSDSVYGVTGVEVFELEKKEERALHAEYEERVRAEEPDDKTLRRELREAKADAAKWKDMYERQKAIVDKILEDPSLQPTRIYQQDPATRIGPDRDLSRTYFLDGVHDHIYFKMNDQGDSTLSIRFTPDGDLEVRNNSIGEELSVIPRSGNELLLRAERRTTRR